MSKSTGRVELEHDTEFFYSPVEFTVENVLFHLPMAPFQRSAFFVKMFNSESKEPNSEGIPRFTLQDVTAAEFRDFLRILMAGPQRWAYNVPPSLNSSNCVSVMDLATRWKFDDVRYVVISAMSGGSRVNPALKFAFGRKFDVKEFLPGSLKELVDRPGPLELKDYQALGMELAVQVAQYRELCRQGADSNPA
ncbi:hypothetical protein C8Q76DRAFT_472572 [Earliella scabrosa]|nr:hypothetical protein C8Q76DRAFT_472572 [Earliella scabrosa]